MNEIQEIKKRVDIINVAKYFGLDLNRANKCKCVFHKEKTASLSFSPSKQIFKCFGCGISGDVITLTSKILNLSPYESAKQLNNIFSLGVEIGGTVRKFELNKYQQVQTAKEQFKKWENETFQLFCDYLHSINPIEYMQQENIVNYYIDEIFINGTEKDKLWFKKNNQNYIKNIKKKVKKTYEGGDFKGGRKY